MMRERGFTMHDYDPFFANDESLLQRQYRFITCTEVIEHVHDPLTVLQTLDRMLLPGGVLGVMTGIVREGFDFRTWWYHRDVTHVRFFAFETFDWVRQKLGWSMERPDISVFLFTKPEVSSGGGGGVDGGGGSDCAAAAAAAAAATAATDAERVANVEPENSASAKAEAEAEPVAKQDEAASKRNRLDDQNNST